MLGICHQVLFQRWPTLPWHWIVLLSVEVRRQTWWTSHLQWPWHLVLLGSFYFSRCHRLFLSPAYAVSHSSSVFSHTLFALWGASDDWCDFGDPTRPWSHGPNFHVSPSWNILLRCELSILLLGSLDLWSSKHDWSLARISHFQMDHGTHSCHHLRLSTSNPLFASHSRLLLFVIFYLLVWSTISSFLPSLFSFWSSLWISGSSCLHVCSSHFHILNLKSTLRNCIVSVSIRALGGPVDHRLGSKDNLEMTHILIRLYFDAHSISSVGCWSELANTTPQTLTELQMAPWPCSSASTISYSLSQQIRHYFFSPPDSLLRADSPAVHGQRSTSSDLRIDHQWISASFSIHSNQFCFHQKQRCLSTSYSAIAWTAWPSPWVSDSGTPSAFDQIFWEIHYHGRICQHEMCQNLVHVSWGGFVCEYLSTYCISVIRSSALDLLSQTQSLLPWLYPSGPSVVSSEVFVSYLFQSFSRWRCGHKQVLGCLSIKASESW